MEAAINIKVISPIILTVSYPHLCSCIPQTSSKRILTLWEPKHADSVSKDFPLYCFTTVLFARQKRSVLLTQISMISTLWYLHHCITSFPLVWAGPSVSLQKNGKKAKMIQCHGWNCVFKRVTVWPFLAISDKKLADGTLWQATKKAQERHWHPQFIRMWGTEPHKNPCESTQELKPLQSQAFR